MIVQAAWRFALKASPHINISPTPAVGPQWEAFIKDMVANDKLPHEQKKPAFLIGNHQSFLDTILTVAIMPSNVTWRCRTYLSSHLYKMPILSTILTAVGHFPVYFSKNSGYNKFSVDREKMDQVQKKVDKHLSNGGVLAFFPEGQMNKMPDVLCDFRYGGFKKALEYDARIWAMVAYGNQQSWPIKCQLGGYPVNGKYDVRAFAPEGCRKKVAQLRELEPAEETAGLADDELLAKYARLDSQGLYDSLRASVTGKSN